MAIDASSPSKKKVLLINPSPWQVTMDAIPKPLPLALLCLASTIPDAFEVILLDRAVNKNDKLLQEYIHHPDLMCVGLSVLTGPPIKDALFISRMIRQVRPEVFIVWGGWHATQVPHSILEEKSVDYIVMGEGEVVFPKMLLGLGQPGVVEALPGVGYSREGMVHLNPPGPCLDINTLPPLPFELIPDIAPYRATNLLLDAPITLHMESSRGCPHQCTFCEVTSYFGSHYSYLSAKSMVDRIVDMQQRYGMEGIRFQDPNFFLRIQRIRDFSNLLLERGIDVKWGAEGTIAQFRNVSEEDLLLFYRAGLRSVGFGIESGNQRVRASLNKKFSNDDVDKIVDKFHRIGIMFKFFMMVGLPGETLEESMDTVDFTMRIVNCYPESLITALISLFLPLPGTPLGQKAVEFGYQTPRTLEEFSDRSFFKGSGSLPWLTPKQAKTLETVSRMARFINFSNRNIPFRGVAKILFRWVRAFYLFRLRKHWFAQTPDIMLLRYFLP